MTQDKTCSIPNCSRKYLAKGFCSTHYWRLRHGHPLDAVIPEKMFTGKECLALECGKLQIALGYCGTHYARLKKGADLDRPIGEPRFKGKRLCSVQGCDRRHKAKGYCSIHHARARKGRPINGRLRADGPIYGRSLNQRGYIVLYVDPGVPGAVVHPKAKCNSILEHRYVMQNHIGRPLLKTETVHHRDGNKTNNNIGNLELRAGAHGAGIRVEDGALRCIEYLERLLPIDLHERAVLAALKAKAEALTFGPFLPPPKGKSKKRN